MTITYFNLSSFLFGFSAGWLLLWVIERIIERRREKRNSLPDNLKIKEKNRKNESNYTTDRLPVFKPES